MKFPSFTIALTAATILASLQSTLPAQTNEPAVSKNSAVNPLSRNDEGGLARQTLVLQRAKDHPGDYDVEFIGDSITVGWEGAGKNVWQEFYGKRKAINFGVGGDRTEHVLWRFEQGQLDGIKAKAAVVMIGTNNSNNRDNTEAEILEGVSAIIKQIRTRQPDTKIILLSIFPRGETFSSQRGKILQVNEALARLDDGKNVFCLNFDISFRHSFIFLLQADCNRDAIRKLMTE